MCTTPVRGVFPTAGTMQMKRQHEAQDYVDRIKIEKQDGQDKE